MGSKLKKKPAKMLPVRHSDATHTTDEPCTEAKLLYKIRIYSPGANANGNLKFKFSEARGEEQGAPFKLRIER